MRLNIHPELLLRTLLHELRQPTSGRCQQLSAQVMSEHPWVSDLCLEEIIEMISVMGHALSANILARVLILPQLACAQHTPADMFNFPDLCNPKL